MNFFTILVNFFVGLLFGVATLLALSPALAAFQSGAVMGWIAVAVVTMMCAYAPNIRRGFGRGFLFLGAALFILPLSAFLISSVAFTTVMSEATADTAAFTAIGAGAAGGVITAFASFFGLILGSLFLIIGLIFSLGGQREVVVVHSNKPRPVPRPKPSQRKEPRLTGPWAKKD